MKRAASTSFRSGERSQPRPPPRSKIDTQPKGLASTAWLAGFLILAIAQTGSRGADVELLYTPDATVAPNRVWVNSQWSSFSPPVFDSAGTFFLKATGFGQPDPEDFQFVGGRSLLRRTGPDQAEALLYEDLHGFYDFQYSVLFPVGAGTVFFGASRTVNEAPKSTVFRYDGTLTPIRDDLQLHGVGRNNGRIVFQDQSAGGLTQPNLSVMSPGSAPVMLARHGDPAPGTDANFHALQQVHYTPEGRVAFMVTLTGGSVTAGTNNAIYRENDKGSLDLLVRNGSPHPPSPLFTGSGSFLSIGGETFGFNSAGWVVFAATVPVDSIPIPSGSVSAVYSIDPTGAIELVALARIDLPTANGGTVNFFSLGAPIIDAQGTIYFHAEESVGNTTRNALWKKTAEGLSRVVTLAPGGLPFPPTRSAKTDEFDQSYSYRLTFELDRMQAGPDGRLAIAGYLTEWENITDNQGNPVSEENRQIGYGLWAQNTDRYWDLIQVATLRPAADNNPAPSVAERLILGGNEIGTIRTLRVPLMQNSTVSGGEDGLAPPWWTADGRLHYSADVRIEGQTRSFYVVATPGIVEPPPGDLYVWDGGAGTLDWHTIANGRSNWVDEEGGPRAEPPTNASDRVRIPGGFSVNLAQEVSEVAVLEVEGTLTLDAALQVRQHTTLGDLNVETGGFLVNRGQVDLDGEIHSTKTGIRADTSGAVLITTKGTISTIAPSGNAVAHGIHVDSANGGITIESEAEISATGTLANASGIFATGSGNVNVTQTSPILASGIGVYAESKNAKATVNTETADLSGDSGGILVKAPAGPAQVTYGKIDAQLAAGIRVSARDDITLSGAGPIFAIGNLATGIEATSTNGGISLMNSGSISTTSSQIAPAIFLTAQRTIDLVNSGDLSTLTGNGIWTRSNAGNLSIRHEEGGIGVGGGGSGGGITAIAPAGSVLIVGEDPFAEIGSGGLQSHGIEASAGGEIEIRWASDITAIGQGALGVLAQSTAGPVSVVLSGNVFAAGSQADGVRLGGPSTLSLTVEADGSVAGPDGAISAGVRFLGGTQNHLLNRGGITSLSFFAIEAGDGDDSVENHGRIDGSVRLGGGANTFVNSAQAELTTGDHLEIGAGNTLSNAGSIFLGNLGEPTGTTAMTGNLSMDPGSRMRAEIESSTNSARLQIAGAAQLGGTLVVHLADDYLPTPGDHFVLIEASSLTGSFDEVVFREGYHPNAPSWVSRLIRPVIDYSGTSVSVSFEARVIRNFGEWKALYFDTTEQADESVSGFFANKDGDLHNNLMEYVWVLHPRWPDDDPPGLTVTMLPNQGGALQASFPWANGMEDFEWVAQVSPDLLTWSDATPLDISADDRGEWSLVTILLSPSPGSANPVFVRIAAKPVSPP